MLANAMSIYKNDEDILIFASGISNSLETKQSEFDREFELLKTHAKTDKKFIYFSTISIFDPSLIESQYIIHKRKIENYIRENCKSFIVFRLPIVVANSDNENTFFNYFKNKIKTRKYLEVKNNAYRYLIDIDDIVSEIPIFIKKFNNKVINIAFNNREKVYKIIKNMEKILKSEAEKKIVYEKISSNYLVDNYLFAKEKSYDNYNDTILKKYLN